jgi:hypothetical protein
MRLKKVDHGDSDERRALFEQFEKTWGYRASGVMRTLAYRSNFFGKHHMRHTQEAMRGPSAWSVGERELFAAYVSHLNQCRF